ncbi:MAG TPA: DNA polymerase/3'-5' exonuclease PolX [Oscillatoriaceae cyanobacterium]
MRNEQVAELLEDIAAALELKGDSGYRIHAYEEAARNVRELGEAIEDYYRDDKLTEIPGVGSSIAEKIAGYLQTGRSPYLESLIREIPRGVFELLKVPGIGPKKANQLYRTLRVTSLKELARAAREHRIREVPGMGAKTEASILKELSRLENRSTRLPLFVAWPLADAVAEALREKLNTDLVEPAGSIRRRKETIGDIDLVVGETDSGRVERAIAALPLTKEILSAGPTKITFLTQDDFQVDVRVLPPETWGAGLLHFTGSKAHNIALRDRAIAMGYKVNEYGVFRMDGGQRIGGATEREVYDILGLPWIPPELRENLGELEAAEAHRLPQLITLEDMRGDLHAHTTYSDGRNSLEEMARAAIARGYEYLAVTDHSHGLGVTHGLTQEAAERQWAEIEALNERLAPFRLIAGVELEIRASGELDFADDFLARFEYVAASLHTGIKQESARITERLVGAIRNVYVDTINHPTGRIVGRRAAYELDLERLFETAAALGKALELNGSERLDLPEVLARRAKELGVVFTLSSDAHSVEGLAAMRYAVAQARRAWLTPDDVLNTRPVRQLLRRWEQGAHVKPKR